MVKKSDFKRAYALFLRGKGKYSFRQVAAKCGISKSSAQRIWHKGLTTEKSTKTSNGTAKRKTGPKHTYIHTHTYTLFQHGRIISTRIKYTNLNIYNVSQKIKIIITVLHDCRARVHILSIL